MKIILGVVITAIAVIGIIAVVDYIDVYSDGVSKTKATTEQIKTNADTNERPDK